MTAPDSLTRQDEVRFTVTYDGAEPEAGRMNAQSLGAAIVSMGKLVETRATLMYGTTTKVSVDVVADFKHGSFAFDVAAAADLREFGQRLVQSIEMGHVQPSELLAHVVGRVHDKQRPRRCLTFKAVVDKDRRI